MLPTGLIEAPLRPKFAAERDANPPKPSEPCPARMLPPDREPAVGDKEEVLIPAVIVPAEEEIPRVNVAAGVLAPASEFAITRLCAKPLGILSITADSLCASPAPDQPRSFAIPC